MRDAEVHDLCSPIFRDANVRRLDVAVDDATLVGEREPGKDVDDDVELRLQRKRLSQLYQVLQIHALNELHRDEEVSIRFAEVVDADDVGVLERCGRLRLVQKALAEVVLPRDRLVHHLDRDVAIEDGVMGPVYDTHRALAYELDDAVLTNR